MRCPDCNKFVSFDTEQDPEESNASIDAQGHVAINVRIVNSCADCGTELKEAEFVLESDAFEVLRHACVKPEFQVEAEYTRTERRQTSAMDELV